MIIPKPLDALPAKMSRVGLALEPSDDAREAEGVLNPASARDRKGGLWLFPRVVGPGNTSRVARVRVLEGEGPNRYEREGYALEPAEEYEMHAAHGYGCEDPRVTFLPQLDLYVMAYTAYGVLGPRIAIAVSEDAYEWQRLGLVAFPPEIDAGDDKDAAFFPQSVMSPGGVPSFAMYHRPMLPGVAVDANSAMGAIMSMPPCEREAISIAYIPCEAVLRDRRNLLKIAETKQVMCPDGAWGRVKLGGGTPPVSIEEGWLSIYHGVDAVQLHPGAYRLVYSAGLVVHDRERPDVILYRSPDPVFVPETEDERIGTVNNVVFPTAIDRRSDVGPRSFDVYYGMADRKIGLARLELETPAASVR